MLEQRAVDQLVERLAGDVERLRARSGDKRPLSDALVAPLQERRRRARARAGDGLAVHPARRRRCALTPTAPTPQAMNTAARKPYRILSSSGNTCGDTEACGRRRKS